MSSPRKASLLFVAGGPDVMSHVFETQAMGYWSAAFDVLLEKHGWLDFDTAEPSVLGNPDELADYDGIIVAWLPEQFWRPEFVDTLRAFPGVVLLEGPIPALAHEWLGIVQSDEERSFEAGPPLVFGEQSVEYIRRRFGSSFRVGHRGWPSAEFVLGVDGEAGSNPLRLLPKDVMTQPRSLYRDQFAHQEGRTPRDNAGRAAMSLAVLFRSRLMQDGEELIFPDPRRSAFAALFLVRCLAKVTEGALRTRLAASTARLLDRGAPSVTGPASDAIARCIWGVAYAEAADVLNEPRYHAEALSILQETRKEGPPSGAESRLWRVLLAVSLLASADRAAELPPDQLRRFLGGEEDEPGQSGVEWWLAASVAVHFADPFPPTLARTMSRLEEIDAAVCGSQGAELPDSLEGLTSPELILAAGALQRAGHPASAELIFDRIARDLYEPSAGLFRNGVVRDARLEAENGNSISPVLGLGFIEVADEIEEEVPGRAAVARYPEAQVAAWATPAFAISEYSSVKGAVEIGIDTGSETLPGLWRDGRVLATSFQLLAQSVHMHTTHPLENPYRGTRQVDATVLEYLLFHIVDRALSENGGAAVKVAPWPAGYDYCATIRHDVDRVLSSEDFERVRTYEDDHGVAVTWFWLPGRLETDQIRVLAEAENHEVGLHSVRYGEKRKEVEEVAAALPPGGEILGEAYHGAGDAWLGHASVREAVEAGLLYTEFVPNVLDLPYWRFPTLERDGSIGAEPIVGMTYNASIDGRQGGDPSTYAGVGLYRQYLNHPDLNFDRLQKWIEALPDGSRLDWTCEQVARWWRATHRREAIQLTRLRGRTNELRWHMVANAEVKDLELWVNADASRVRAVEMTEGSDAVPAEWRQLDIPELTGVAITLTLQPATEAELSIQLAPRRRRR